MSLLSEERIAELATALWGAHADLPLESSCVAVIRQAVREAGEEAAKMCAELKEVECMPGCYRDAYAHEAAAAIRQRLAGSEG